MVFDRSVGLRFHWKKSKTYMYKKVRERENEREKFKQRKSKGRNEIYFVWNGGFKMFIV